MGRVFFFVQIVVLLLTCVSCSGGNKQAYFLSKGEECSELLISELSDVRSLQDLFEKQDDLTILFDRIAQLSIEARAYQLKTKAAWSATDEAESRNIELRKQLLRVLRIPGARAFLEGCQAAAFEKIYAFELQNSRDHSSQ